MENISRSHHYVPQFYLTGFTIDGSIKSKLTVIDKTAQKRFETIPRNVGAQRDFNRVDIPGQPIDAVERALAEFDGQAAGVLKKIANKEVLPNTETEDFSVIMHFIALLGIRNPKLRTNMNSTHEQIGKMMAHQVVATRAGALDKTKINLCGTWLQPVPRGCKVDITILGDEFR